MITATIAHIHFIAQGCGGSSWAAARSRNRNAATALNEPEETFPKHLRKDLPYPKQKMQAESAF
jgi:hypothetical protein